VVMNPSSNPQATGASASGVTSMSLLPKVKARDPEAWQRLVRLYSPLVFHWCRRAGLSADDSADVVQDVFLAVAKRVGDFRHDPVNGSFRAWLRAICRFKVADHYRTKYTEPTAVGGSTAYRDLLQQTDGIDADDAEGDRGRLLRTALDLVRGDFAGQTWDAFWKYTVENHSVAEVAATLGLSPDSVYQAKARVLRRLRDEFEHLLD
jgi:RNA polymerase sigma-70 factor, ECF subfamily